MLPTEGPLVEWSVAEVVKVKAQVRDTVSLLVDPAVLNENFSRLTKVLVRIFLWYIHIAGWEHHLKLVISWCARASHAPAHHGKLRGIQNGLWLLKKRLAIQNAFWMCSYSPAVARFSLPLLWLGLLSLELVMRKGAVSFGSLICRWRHRNIHSWL